MLSLFNGYRSDERGATATEYAMLIAIAVGATALGGGINNLFNNVANTLSNVQVPNP